MDLSDVSTVLLILDVFYSCEKQKRVRFDPKMCVVVLFFIR